MKGRNANETDKKLSGLADREKQGTPKVKVCEACGTGFDCFTPRGPCWCEDVKLSSETLAELRAQYRECLCPACLKDAAAKEQSSLV
jgi:hypothetical protein